MKIRFFLSFSLLALLLPFIMRGQGTFKYYFDKDWGPVNKEKATIWGRGMKTNEGLRADFFQVGNNQLLGTTIYTDSTLKIINGRNLEYHPNGKMALKNNYIMNKLEGESLEWDTLGNLTDSVIYQNNLAVYKMHKAYNQNNILIYVLEVDSINNSASERNFAMDGSLVSEAFFSHGRGYLKTYETNGSVKTDSIFINTPSKEATYPGGVDAWSRYLGNNLRADVAARANAPVGDYTVIVQFTVETDGKLSNIKALTNYGFGMEEEALRVIKFSGKWIPSENNGIKVKAFRKQPITFRVSGISNAF